MKKLLIAFILILQLPLIAQNNNCQIDTAKFGLISKETYEIAYFIPLSLDKSISGSAMSKKKFDSYTKYYYQFYQGVLMALDQIEVEYNELPQLNIHIIDSESPSKGLYSWSSTALGKFDMIFSAMSDDENKLALRLAKSQVPLISCLSLADIDAPYPFYVHVQPSLQVHCENIARDIESNYGNDVTISSFIDGSTVSTNALTYSGLRKSSQVMRFDYEFNTNDLATKLDSFRVNVIFAPILNESNARRLLDSLSKLSYFQFDIFGMPTWSGIDLPKYTKNGRNTITFTTGFHKGSRGKGQKFLEDYKARYNTAATSVSVKGYESTLYFLSKFIERPEYFFMDMVNDTSPRPINEFLIRPRCINGSFSFWENQNTYSIISRNGQLDTDFN